MHDHSTTEAPRSVSTRVQAAGFSLVELMVAMTAAMVLLGATYAAMDTMFASRNTMTGIVETQQRARVAINEIAGEVLRAGTGMPTGGVPIPNGSGSTTINWPGLAAALPAVNNILPTIMPGDGLGPAIGGGGRGGGGGGPTTDAIALLTIDQLSTPLPVASFDPAQDRVDFAIDIHTSPNELFEGDLLVFSNANANVFGVVTSVHATQDRATFADGDALDFNQPGAANGNMASLQNPGSPVTYPPTTATKVRLVTYYLDAADPIHPTLIRKVNGQPPQVVANDVTDLQFTYDLYDFTTATGASDQATTASPNQIRSVSIRLTGRSTDIDRRTDMHYSIELLSKVSVRNATFRNRYTGN